MRGTRFRWVLVFFGFAFSLFEWYGLFVKSWIINSFVLTVTHFRIDFPFVCMLVRCAFTVPLSFGMSDVLAHDDCDSIGGMVIVLMNKQISLESVPPVISLNLVSPFVHFTLPLPKIKLHISIKSSSCSTQQQYNC